MTKLFLTILIFTTVFCSCSNQTTTEKDKLTSVIKKTDTTKYNGLHGTWVRHNKEGFTLIEINDTSNVLYYEFADRKVNGDTITTDRYWYYKSKATMGYRSSPTNSYKADVHIWIATDKFRFDYKMKGDTLIEFDKMGDQGNFVKVYNDDN